MNHLLLPCLVATLALLPAQDPHPTTAPAAPDQATLLRLLPPRIAIHDEGVDAELGPLGTWAAGRDYKCGFADGAFVLVPYLGAAAPTAPAWRWQTAAVNLGDRDLLGADERREQFSDFRYRRTRGLVTEQWDVFEHGVEQSFVVERPAGALKGDLRVTGCITTPLRAAPREPAHGELLFAADGAEYRLRYGAAVAIDAAGRECPVTSSFDGTLLTLHVPEAFVAIAAWPLVIDPLLTPLALFSGSSLGVGDVDLDAIAGDNGTQHLALVWSRGASSGDHDLHVFRCASDFSSAVLLGSEISATASSREGSITGSWIDRTIAVAWSRAGSVSSTCFVATLAANVVNGSLALAQSLPKPNGTNERQPRIGAAKVFDMAPARALCVRLRDTSGGVELWGSLVVTTTNQVTSSFVVDMPAGAGQPILEPWVSKSIRGDYEGWLVSFQYWNSIFSRWQVAVRKVNYLGQVETYIQILAGLNPTRHLMRPRIDGSFGRHTVVCVSAPTATYPGQITGVGTAIEAQRVDWIGNTAPTTPWPMQTLMTHTTRGLTIDSVAINTSNYSHWLVGARLGGGLHALLLGYRGALIERMTLPPPPGIGTHTGQDLAVAFSPQQNRFCMLYDHTTSIQGTIIWSCRGLVFEYAPVPPLQFYGPSCGLAAISCYGESRIGNQFFSFGPSGLTPGEWVIAGVSLASASVPFANLGLGGGCTLNIDLAQSSFLASVFLTANPAGFGDFSLPLPENLGPLDLYVQFIAAGATPSQIRASRGCAVAIR